MLQPNAPTKRHRLAEWIQKPRPVYMLSTRDPLQTQEHIQTESEEMEKRYSMQMEIERKLEQLSFSHIRQNRHIISDKIDFEIKTITRDKEGHYIMIKGSIQEEDITIVTIYAPNIGAPQYIRQMLTAIKGEIDSNTITVGDFNSPLSPIDRPSKMK